jgi:hypothetical protein
VRERELSNELRTEQESAREKYNLNLIYTLQVIFFEIKIFNEIKIASLTFYDILFLYTMLRLKFRNNGLKTFMHQKSCQIFSS